MKRLVLIMALAASLMTLGCASESGKKKKATTPPVVDIPDGPFVPDGSGPGSGPGDQWQFGGTAALDVPDLSVFQTYTNRVMNDPQDVRININLKQYGNGYGGTVTIAYTDNGISYQGYFTSGTTKKEVKYNIWFTKNNKGVWHGFFEDFLGAIVVVIDDVIDLGDGNGPDDKVGGSVWFKNFGLTYAPHPPTRCWFVSIGPYDCRAWKSGDGVNTTKAINPDSGYVKLGEFEDLSLEDAFNGSI